MRFQIIHGEIYPNRREDRSACSVQCNADCAITSHGCGVHTCGGGCGWRGSCMWNEGETLYARVNFSTKTPARGCNASIFTGTSADWKSLARRQALDVRQKKLLAETLKCMSLVRLDVWASLWSCSRITWTLVWAWRCLLALHVKSLGYMLILEK